MKCWRRRSGRGKWGGWASERQGARRRMCTHAYKHASKILDLMRGLRGPSWGFVGVPSDLRFVSGIEGVSPVLSVPRLLMSSEASGFVNTQPQVRSSLGCS